MKTIGLVVVLFVLVTPIRGQDFQYAEVLHKDTAALIWIENLHEFRKQVENIPAFDTDNLDRLKELLCYGDYAIVEPSEWDSVVNSIRALSIDAKSLLVVVNPPVNSIPQISLVLIESPSRGELQLESIKDSVTCLAESVTKLFTKQSESTAGDSADNGDAFGLPFGIRIERISNFVVISNDVNFVADLKIRVSDRKANDSLANSRSFQRIANQSNRKNQPSPDGFVYLNPQFARLLYEFFSESEWSMLQLDEFRAVGCSLNLAADSKSLNEHPIVSGKVQLKHTFPPPNYVKVVDTYYPFGEIPPFAYPIVELNLVARDPVMHYRINKDIYDEQHGAGEYDQLVTEPFRDDVRDYFKDVLPRTDYYVNVRYTNRFGYNGVMAVRKIKDQAAMMRYAEGLVKMTNRNRTTNRFSKTVESDETYWTLSPSALQVLADKITADSKGKDFGFDINPDTVPSEGYAIAHGWYLHGDHHDIKRQLRFCLDQDGKNYSAVINERTKYLQQQYRMQDPYFLEVTSPWHSYIWEFEKIVKAHLQSKYRHDKESYKEHMSAMYYEKKITFPIEGKEDTRIAAAYEIGKLILESAFQKYVICTHNELDNTLEIAFAFFGKPEQ